MINFVIFLIFSCLHSSAVATNDVWPEIRNGVSKNDAIYNIMVTFLKTCELNSRKVIIYNNVTHQDDFSAVAEIQPKTSVTLLSNVIAWKKIAPYRLLGGEVDVVVIVIQLRNAWTLMKNLFTRWQFKRNCTIYVLPVPLHECAHYAAVLRMIMRFYLPVAYFICIEYNVFPIVYTYDPYGDTKPSGWHETKRESYWGKNWTFYSRSYHLNTSGLCSDFHFKRTDPMNTTIPIIGLRRDQITLKSQEVTEQLFDDEIEQYFSDQFTEQARNLKRLLKLQFKYFTVTPPLNRSERTLQRAYDTTDIDAFIFARGLLIENPFWQYFNPTSYDTYAILSHSRGCMTPLEKISEFYGIWTLSSLILILMITCLVTWLLTKRVSLAAFDVIRLLINSAVAVPITTGAKKFFFSFIFLYFLVIHATFSGHLAEFLTKIDYRDNIDTLGDLMDPQIQTIYCFGFRFNEIESMGVLGAKSRRISKSTECSLIKDRPDSTCISLLSSVLKYQLELKDNNNTLYVSSETFGFSMISNVYRLGFPLREQFNWAIVYLFDTAIVNQLIINNGQRMLTVMKTEDAKIPVGYRDINVHDLNFAFVLLMIGSGVGFICFVIEISFTIIYIKLKTN